MTGGRCHGPNCTREATDGPWCDPTCRDAWHAQFHWLHGDGEAVEPVLFRESDVVVNDDAQSALAAALEAAQPELEQHLAAVIQAADPPPASTFTVAEVARIAASLPRDRPGEPVKLTEEQFDALTRAFPDRPGWSPNGELGRWDGVPVEFVETVEESTPYLLLAERAQSARLATGGLISGPPRDPSDDRIPALLSEGGCVTFWRGDHSGNHPLDGLPVSKCATDPQVAPTKQQVGFLDRAFHWLFGRTG